MRTPRFLVLASAIVLGLAACSSTGSGYGPTQPPTHVPASAAAGAVVVGASSSATFGTVLTGPNGLTLYTHAGDTATSSTCAGACATAWPPLATTGQPTAGPGVTGQLGTARRADGSIQVTYDGRPLYYWQGDTKPGDVTGDGVEGFSVATVRAVGAAPKPSQALPTPMAPSGYSY